MMPIREAHEKICRKTDCSICNVLFEGIFATLPSLLNRGCLGVERTIEARSNFWAPSSDDQ